MSVSAGAIQGIILIVEDSPNLREMLEMTLRFKGYTVASAQDGEEALQIVEQQKPALVITDLLMPNMDGYALAYRLRKSPLTSGIPIIFISATYITPEDKKFALSLGGARFVEKPIDNEEFLLTVAEVATQGINTVPRPMSEEDFLSGYRERLQSKLQHKNTQIARTERLLGTLPAQQRPAFQAMLEDVIATRDQIQAELDKLKKQ
jgi:CheY-like chemotaxis protein